MRLNRGVSLALAAALLSAVTSAGQGVRRTVDPAERAAVLALISSVDAVEANDNAASAFTWDNHVLKSVDRMAFVPFHVFPPEAFRPSKTGVMYVRAVSRHDGIRSKQERSFVRDWLLNNATAPLARQETVFVSPGEMPIGGPAASSSRDRTQAAAAASAQLTMQTREIEKQRAANEAAAKRAETEEKDPFRFPFEEYFTLANGPIERALALPAGEYDVYIGLVDRDRLKTTIPAVAHHTVTIPDFWNSQLTLSSLILASDVHTLPSRLSREAQASHPYTFGQAEVVPVTTPQFSQHDALSIVYQICNYGAPDTDLTANYAFYQLDGERRLFNRTNPQFLGDDDLPRPLDVWETQAFTMQAVSLQPFPPGSYEVEVSVRDNLTRAVATATARFAVKP